MRPVPLDCAWIRPSSSETTRHSGKSSFSGTLHVQLSCFPRPRPSPCVPPKMRFGTEIVSDGVRFRLWAPKHERIDIVIHEPDMRFAMMASRAGWHTILVPEAGPGTLYRFVLPDGLEVPDPASRFQ